ncbi:MAG: hypothetical protein KF752_09675 [Pirellulaceae bacterium]|nr:hypothetical protein [Pirellulaceae bacterium]
MLPKDSIRMHLYYGEIALKDSWRSRTTLLTTATVFAGICLLLLVLAGLKSGLVQQLRDDIGSNPSSIKGDLFATSDDLALSAASEADLIAGLPPGTIIVPEITKLGTILTPKARVDGVTLQTTVPGDPILAYHGAGISGATAPELVVSPAVAQTLGLSDQAINSGTSNVTIELTRSEGREAITARLQVSVRAVFGTEGSKSKTAYLSRHFMEQLEDFTKGEAVIEHAWPGLPVEDSIGHQGYLAFTKQAYSGEDIKRLHLRGFKAMPISYDNSIQERSRWRDLYGMLKPHDLHVYLVTSQTQSDRLEQYLNFEVSEVEDITTCDDVMLYWSEPTAAKIDGKDHRLVGISGSLKWLRGYFVDTRVRMIGAELPRVMIPFGTATTDLVGLELSDGQTLNLTCSPPPTGINELKASKLYSKVDAFVPKFDDFVEGFGGLLGNMLGSLDALAAREQSGARATLLAIEQQIDANRDPIAIVPASLLAAVHRHRQGTLTFDPTTQNFERANTPNRYYSGRFYARVLDDVPVIDEHLQSLGYSTVSSRLQVLEMQGYAGTLDLLVVILQVIAVFLGFVTSSVIFMEVTRRRQTSIGIMQIMGMQSQGIFLFVFFRAILIAGLGWAMASVLSLLIATGLPLIANAECRLSIVDFAQVFVGAILCSALGVAYHAYAATKLDPMLAIKSGKVQ